MTEAQRVQRIHVTLKEFWAKLRALDRDIETAHDVVFAYNELEDALNRHFRIEMTICSLCSNETPTATAHLHQGAYIGDECCWDERLRTSE